jgi:hypothetical protein
MRRFLITTETGSVYNVGQRDDGTWWLSAKNVATPQSEQLTAEHEWQILPPQPWPPVQGQRVVLATAYLADFGNPLRIPRGGKLTSPVVTVSEIGLS